MVDPIMIAQRLSDNDKTTVRDRIVPDGVSQVKTISSRRMDIPRLSLVARDLIVEISQPPVFSPTQHININPFFHFVATYASQGVNLRIMLVLANVATYRKRNRCFISPPAKP